ncbi:MAG: DUF3313 domain-containing protein [Gammaproteobacteria bacterium]|nr:DUF3313 domain-containing protein [Gammaproteobacteria bacterium]NNJ77740.1 DUF3313 family protein [Xanthomonadales bacterium]
MCTIRGKLVVGLVLVLFSLTALAQTSMEPTWVKEGVDWSQYDKFLVKPLDIDDVRMVPPPWAENPETWELNIENLNAVQAIYRDVVKAELGYPVVYAPAPGVLELDVEILSVTPWLRPGSGGTKDGMQVTTMGTGELSASVEIRDAQTRELLLMMASDKSVGEEYKEFTRANNAANIEKMFKGFANRLRAAMDRVHGK